MEPLMNQDSAANDESDKVGSGLAPKQNPTIGKDRRAALPHAISGIDVDSSNGKPKKAKKNSTPNPAVPEDVIRKVRRGATVAMLLAAGISARTLFQLGEIIGLPKGFAWMLPGAFDVYAYTSATVAAAIPAVHPARRWAVWNARVALTFTMVGNSLVHALYLMSHGQKWTGTDYALVAVSAIPPIIVERLLHLQTKIAADTPVAVTMEAETGSRKPSTPASATAERKQLAEAPASTPVSTPASNPLPASTPTESPAASTRTRPAASTASRPVASGPIPIQRAARLEVVRGWIDSAGGDKEAVPLKEIQERFGVSQATASRMRAEAAEMPSRPASQPEQAADEEPERVREAV